MPIPVDDLCAESETTAPPSSCVRVVGPRSRARVFRGPPAAGRPVRRAVILEADDLGLMYAFNEGIRLAHREGCLTSTCLRANGYAYEHAIDVVVPSCPQLGLGVHLSLNEGPPVSPRARVPLLLDRGGHLRAGFSWLMRLARTVEGRDQIERELRAQIERILGDGLAIDHLNSHKHVHMIPEIFGITCGLAREYEIPCVRLTREPAHRAPGLRRRIEPFLNANRIKHALLNRFATRNAAIAAEYGVLTTDAFVGVTYTGGMSLDTIATGLEACGEGCVEVLLHPAVGPDPRDAGHTSPFYAWYIPDPARAEELRTLTWGALPDWLRREQWQGITHAAWARAAGSRRPRRLAVEANDDIRHLCDSIVVRNPPWVSAAQADARAFAELVLSRTRPGDRVLDLGTGTGILAICLARAGRIAVGTDVSAAAVRNARRNAARNAAVCECYGSDLLDSVKGRFDLIAFNPPYNVGPDGFVVNVAKNLVRRIPWVQRNCGRVMPGAVVRFHQHLLRRLMAKAPDRLVAGGCVLLHAFGAEVADLCRVLPPGAVVQILEHPSLTPHGTVGLCITPR